MLLRPLCLVSPVQVFATAVMPPALMPAAGLQASLEPPCCQTGRLLQLLLCVVNAIFRRDCVAYWCCAFLCKMPCLIPNMPISYRPCCASLLSAWGVSRSNLSTGWQLTYVELCDDRMLLGCMLCVAVAQSCGLLPDDCRCRGWCVRAKVQAYCGGCNTKAPLDGVLL